MCRSCNREYQRAHYKRNRPEYIAKALIRTGARRAENLTRILEYLASHPCVDCGLADPLVLHFDHVRGRKLGDIGTMAQSTSTWERIVAEIEKCEIRCATCHFKRHADRERWLKLTLATDASVRAPSLPTQNRSDLPFEAERTAAIATLKWCGVCGQDLPLTDFAKRGGESRCWKCKHCQREYSRDHYRRNRAAYLARVRVRHRTFLTENMALVVAYLSTHPCVDCGEDNPVVLQFDHVRGVKTRNLARMVREGARRDRIQLEISKCDVRCVNCHFRRHARTRDTRKYRTLEGLASNLGAARSGAPSSSG